jgi:chromosome segregation ATPase
VTGRDAIIGVIIALAGGGLIGGIVSWRKAGPERTNIMISTAQLLVGMAREDVERLDRDNERLEVRLNEVEHELRAKIAHLEAERDRLRRELETERSAKEQLEAKNQALTERVRHLEEDLEKLRNGG